MLISSFSKNGNKISIITNNYTEIDLHCRIYHNCILHPDQICYRGDNSYCLKFTLNSSKYHSIYHCINMLKTEQKGKLLSDLLSLIDCLHQEGYYNYNLDPKRIFISVNDQYSIPIFIDFREIVYLDCCYLEEQYHQYIRIDNEQFLSLINYLDMKIEIINDFKSLGYIVQDIETGIIKYPYFNWKDGIDMIDKIAEENEIDRSFRIIYLIYDLYHRGLIFLPPPTDNDKNEIIQILSIVVFMIGCRFMHIECQIDTKYDNEKLEQFETTLMKNLRYHINRDLLYDREDDFEKIDLVVKNPNYLRLV